MKPLATISFLPSQNTGMIRCNKVHVKKHAIIILSKQAWSPNSELHNLHAFILLNYTSALVLTCMYTNVYKHSAAVLNSILPGTTLKESNHP